MSTEPFVLIVEDDPLQRRALERMLQHKGFPVTSAGTGQEALQVALNGEVVVAIIDLDLPDTSGIDVIRRLREVRPHVECVVLTGMRSDETAQEARLAGASDYFEKTTMDRTRFLQVVKRAWEVQHLKQTIGLLGTEASPTLILGVSARIQEVRKLVDRMAAASAAVLVTGESGVGKEVVAEALHEQSRRRGELVRINCAALPESLIEAELFGAEDGSFTGQKGRKEGLFALADNGTLFLDEIGEMPIGLQPKLLRVLQSHSFRPIGSRTERPLTARVIAATNVDLRAATGTRAFREDLYFRLAVLTIEVPPLREREADIALLANHFAKKFAASEGRAGIRLSDEALEGLTARRWPGNVRELANTILRAVVLSSSRVIGLEDLGFAERAPSAPSGDPSWDAYMDQPLTEAKAAVANAFTRAYLERRLAESGGNVSRAAAVSGMQRPNFKREMRRLGVEVADDE